MQKSLIVVLVIIVFCLLALAAGKSVLRPASEKQPSPSGLVAVSRAAADSLANAGKVNPPANERHLIDPSMVEPVRPPSVQRTEPNLSLKEQIGALQRRLFESAARRETTTALKNRISELLAQLRPAATFQNPPLTRTGRPVEVSRNAPPPDLGTLSVSARGPDVPLQSSYVAVQPTALPEGVTLSASAGEPANRVAAAQPRREMNESIRMEMESLQRQAEAVQASGGDVAPIKNRMSDLLGQSRGEAAHTRPAAVVSPQSISTQAFSGEVVEPAIASPYDPDRDEINSLLAQRKELEIAGRDFTEIDARLAELTPRGRETVDDNGGVTFYSAHGPLSLPHFSCVEGTIAVSNLGPLITDVEVQIDTLTYPYNLSLVDVYLISPAGDTCTLSTGNGGSGHNYYNTRFDDDAATSITAGSSPFTGSYRPEEPLSVFDGENPNGTWKLRVCDNDDNNGYLRRWRLQILAALPGDTCGNAIPLTVPAAVTGNTCAYHDNYDWVCPYTGSLSHDVVYSYTSPANQQVTFGLCRSGYDTKLYIYDGVCSGTPIACNDDASPCIGSTGFYRSILPCVQLQSGHTYYVVVDGYGGACGDYALEAGICPPCTLTCLGTDTIECTEVPDTSHNRLDCDGGCNNAYAGGIASYDTIQCGDTVCGLGFTYVWQGYPARDTDWFQFTLSERSRVRATVFAEFKVHLIVMDTLCPTTTLYWTTGDSCDTLEWVTPCLNAGTYRFFVAPLYFAGVPIPQHYRLEFDCDPCPPGTDCVQPLTLSPGATLTEQTNCGYLDDYSATCLGDYDGGEDIIYKLTLTATGDYAVLMDPHGTGWTGLLVDDQCPPGGAGACIAYHWTPGSTPYGFTSLHLAADTYYVMVDTWPDPDCIPEFDLAVGRVYSCVTCQPSDCTECAEVVDSTNAWLDCDGGCNNLGLGGEALFENVACGDTVCGKAFTYVRDGSTYRDTDWYEFTLWEFDTVRAYAVGEFPLQLNVLRIDSGCAVVSLDFALVNACDTADISLACLEPGTYAVFVAPTVYVGVPYPLDYRVWVSCSPCPPGQDCNSPIDITDGTTLPARTTQGLLNDYSNTCLGNYDSGPDIIFRWMITQEGDYQVRINPYSSGFTGVLLDDNCPPDVSGCIAFHFNTAEAPHGISCRHLTAGTYYIMVDNWPNPPYIPNFDLITAPCYTCVTPQQGDLVECAEIVDTSHARLDCDGGCNVPDRTFGTVACGHTIAGRSFTYVVGGSSYRDTDWYRFDVAVPESVHVSATAEFPLLVFVIQLLNDSCSYSIVTYAVAAPCSTLELTTARLDTGAYVLWAGPSGFGGIPDPADYRVTMTCLPCDTPGRDCATAIPISDDTTLTSQTTCGLGHDYEGSCLGAYSWGEDILYRWTVTQEADYTIWLNPHDSGWTGILLDDQCPPDSEECIATHTSGADFSHGIACQHLTPGTYYIMVDTWPEPDCIPVFDLSITTANVPANDLCANATVVMVPSTTYGTTKCATLDAIPDCPDAIEAPGVWYQIVGTGSTITATLCSTSTRWDSKLALFTCGCESLYCEGENDDYCGGASHAQLSWCSRAGEVYWLLVHAEFNSMGDFRLDLSDDGTGCPYPVRCPCWDTTMVAPGQISGSTSDADNSCQLRASNDRVVRVVIPYAGFWNFSLCGGSNFDTYLYIGTDCCLSNVGFSDDFFCGGNLTLYSEICVNLPVAGYYYATVEGFSESSQGNYTLDVQPSAGAVPPQVTGVQATDNLCGIVAITWNNVPDEAGYLIFAQGYYVWTVAADCTNTFDFGAVPGSARAYVVRAVSACGEAPNSAPDSGLALPSPGPVLGVTASDASCTEVLITWDNVANEDGYYLLRNGSSLATVGPDTTTFGDTVAPGTYTYSVRSFNNACGESGSAPEDQGTRLPTPTAVSNLSATTFRCDAAALTWTDALYETSYVVRRNGVPIGVALPAGTTSYFDSTGAADTMYTYTVLSINSCGGAESSALGRRLAPPAQVTGVAASGNFCAYVRVTWSDVTGEAGYQVLRGGTPIGGSLPANQTSYNDSTAAVSVLYTYAVAALGIGCSGPVSAGAVGTRVQALLAVSGVAASDSNCTGVAVGWNNMAGEDSFQVRRNGQRIAGVAANVVSIFDSTALPGQTYTYRVVAYNNCGAGDSSGSDAGRRRAVPQSAPVASIPDSCNTAHVCWSGVTDADAYNLLIDAVPTDQVAGTVFCYDFALSPGTHQFTVQAVNLCGNGPLSNPLAIGFSPLPTVTGLVASDTLCGEVLLSWSATANAAGFIVYRNGIPIDTTFIEISEDVTAVPFVVYAYTVAGYNACGLGAQSAPDSGMSLASPAVVTGVGATTNRCDSVIVIWGDVTHETGFRIFRDGLQVATPAANVTRYADAPAPGSYAYTVRAVNSCGPGPLSGAQTGTRLAAPGAPTGVVASDDLCGEVVIWWSGATGDVDSVRFYRNGALIGSADPSAESFVDSPAVGAFAYTVRAFSLECGLGPVSLPDSGHGHAPAGQPSALAVVAPATCDSIRLTWQAGGGESDGYIVRRDGIVIDTAQATHYTDQPVNNAYDHAYSVTAYNLACGAGTPTASVEGNARALLEILTTIPDTAWSGRWLALDLNYCTDVISTCFFLSQDGGPYETLRVILPSNRDSLFFDPVTNPVPDCRLAAVSRRGLRFDTLITDPFILEPPSTAADWTEGQIPGDYFLGQNYPNPFNPTTTIRFGVPAMSQITIEVYDLLGRKMADLFAGLVQPGVHSVVWDCSTCPSGMYLVRMRAENRLILRKVLLLK